MSDNQNQDDPQINDEDQQWLEAHYEHLDG